MAEHVRVATFEADEAALNELVKRIKEQEGPPEGVPATAIMVLADRAGRVRIVTRFGSEEDLRRGSETLDAMTPPPDTVMQRVSVETFEVVLERQAP